MTSSELRNSFLNFFRSKEHSLVSSSSLRPDSPNLLFTNAGMNQFVPIFLGTTPCPYTPPRAANSQKCIRAGGKHNDLEDVGLDTYHHTFFEMLGNWSFGDYFKKEAIAWAWELLVEIWKFPPTRLYATIYQPAPGDPASFDQEAYDLWAELFLCAGLDPKIHIVPGDRHDNFWMMGETGPCGPCSELHVDLTPAGDTQGALVNKGTAECIEIWNLVFIEWNASTDGSFLPLKQRHVDTGMGFERLCSIMQATRGFREFGQAAISNYETDLFRPIFKSLQEMSGLHYTSTLPQCSGRGLVIAKREQEKIDIAFRVIADHLRTLVFAIADGIEPGNSDRNYVLRRILRRAVRYGRTLGFEKPFLYLLSPLLTSIMGEAFPELRTHEAKIASILYREEEAFHKTLEKGLALFEEEASSQTIISGSTAFRLYDEQGFPLDLTELLARERGLSVDHTGFERLMEQQRTRARASQKKEVIHVSSLVTKTPTLFLGFEELVTPATLLETLSLGNDRMALIFEHSVFYSAMGGQVGDTGTFETKEKNYSIIDTQKQGACSLHIIEGEAPIAGTPGILRVTDSRRHAIERHHTATHLLHWALRETLGSSVTQKGSFVGSEKLTFDFNAAPLSKAQLKHIEEAIHAEILKNHVVSSQELPYAMVRERHEIMQFFGEKYGERVRVVQIGGEAGGLNGFSMELCGGTHVGYTGQIGLFRILSEGAVGAGIRRIEAVAGLVAYDLAKHEATQLANMATTLRVPLEEVEQKLESLLTKLSSLEKELHARDQEQAIESAQALLSEAVIIGTIPTIVATLPRRNARQLEIVIEILQKRFEGVVLLAGTHEKTVSLMATVSKSFASIIAAQKLIQSIAPLLGGKGGGTPYIARGAGPGIAELSKALNHAKESIAAMSTSQ